MGFRERVDSGPSLTRAATGFRRVCRLRWLWRRSPKKKATSSRPREEVSPGLHPPGHPSGTTLVAPSAQREDDGSRRRRKLENVASEILLSTARYRELNDGPH